MNNWPEPSHKIPIVPVIPKRLSSPVLIGDVHLVSHCEIFNEAPKCISQQVTRRPLALQDERYYKQKMNTKIIYVLKLFWTPPYNKLQAKQKCLKK